MGLHGGTVVSTAASQQEDGYKSHDGVNNVRGETVLLLSNTCPLSFHVLLPTCGISDLIMEIVVESWQHQEETGQVQREEMRR